MNPKDMTNECLLHWHGDTQGVDEDNPSLMKAYGEIYYELLRRLDETDALRKENAVLRNLLGECPKRNNSLGTYSDAKPVQIDVCKLICMAKESEASHE